MWLGEDDTVQGLGCPGGTCMGADGNLYEWVQGVDGLGNPIGFWKRLKRGLRRVAPLARRLAPLVPGGAAAAALTAAAPYLRRVAPYVQQAAAPEAASTAGWGGLGAEELTQVMGIGYAGEMAEGPDGHLYQWVQGVDGLGNPVGFWKRLKRGIRSVARRALPLAKQFAPFIPGGAAALTVATPFLRQAGVTGADGIGALYEAPDGSLYQVQGVGEDDELRGLEDDELRGLADDELRGLEDDELQGLGDDDELRGLEDDELRGMGDEEIQGFGDDDVQGTDGYVRDGMNGLDGFIPDSPRETPPFRGSAQSSPMWTPLW